jgi:IS30 family transposase
MNQIAKALRGSQSTVSRGISRNAGQLGYRHKQANRLAEQRHKDKPKSVKLTEEIRQLSQGCLKQDWSPEQVAGRLKEEGLIKLHHETIYQYIGLARLQWTRR